MLALFLVVFDWFDLGCPRRSCIESLELLEAIGSREEEGKDEVKEAKARTDDGCGFVSCSSSRAMQSHHQSVDTCRSL